MSVRYYLPACRGGLVVLVCCLGWAFSVVCWAGLWTVTRTRRWLNALWMTHTDCESLLLLSIVAISRDIFTFNQEMSALAEPDTPITALSVNRIPEKSTEKVVHLRRSGRPEGLDVSRFAVVISCLHQKEALPEASSSCCSLKAYRLLVPLEDRRY